MKTRNQAITHAFSLLTIDNVLFRAAIKEQRAYAPHNQLVSNTLYTKARVLGFAVCFIRDFFVQGGKSFDEIAFGLISQSAIVRLGASIAMHAIDLWMDCYNRPFLNRFKGEDMFTAFLELEPWMHYNMRTAGSNGLNINIALKDERR